MTTELVLKYYDDSGRLVCVKVDSPRFTIGRDPESDLVIRNSSLSRRHALIEKVGNVFRLADCNSSNGTFLNGTPVDFSLELNDRDVINLGEAHELDVELKTVNDGPVSNRAWTSESRPLSYDAMRALDRDLSARNAPRVKVQSGGASSLLDKLDLRIVLPIITVMLVGLLALVLALRGPTADRASQRDEPRLAVTATREPPRTVSTPIPVASPVVTQPASEMDDELDEVEKNTLAVMRAISLRDTNPVLTQPNDREIYERVKSYKGSASLRENLRMMKSRGVAELAGPAKAQGIKPALLVFAALAYVDKSGRGDPVAVARELIPQLARNQVYLAKDMAHDNLLAFAATDSSTGGPMALRDEIAALSKRSRDKAVQTIRNVWYLRDAGVLKPPAFDLVLRFLAIGAIAQNPSHYGIDAEPLAF